MSDLHSRAAQDNVTVYLTKKKKKKKKSVKLTRRLSTRAERWMIIIRLYRQSVELPRNTMFNHVVSLVASQSCENCQEETVALPAISSLAHWLTVHVVHPPTSVLRFFTFDLRGFFQSLNIRGRTTLTLSPRSPDASL